MTQFSFLKKQRNLSKKLNSNLKDYRHQKRNKQLSNQLNFKINLVGKIGGVIKFKKVENYCKALKYQIKDRIMTMIFKVNKIIKCNLIIQIKDS